MSERDASQVADLLEEIGRRAAFEDDNPYRSRAYLRAAASLRHLVRPLGDLIRNGELHQIPGVGPAIARRIEALHRAGTDAGLEAMRAKLPAGLLELLAVPGLRPATMLKLHDLLGVNSLADLAAACREDRVALAKGLGRALQSEIRHGLALASAGEARLRLNRAGDILEQVISELRRLRPELQDLTIAGEFRRGCELVSDLRLVAIDPNAAEVTQERLGAVTLHISPPARFGAVLLSATGSAGHVAQLAERAHTRGLSLSAEALLRGAKPLSTRREDIIYRTLGLPFIPPELREGAGEIARASSGLLPELVSAQDLRGVLHLHTVFSDGLDTLEDMAEAARRRRNSRPACSTAGSVTRCMSVCCLPSGPPRE
jgi:DNA polymerase (family 10)